jgi:hypothetical protein
MHPQAFATISPTVMRGDSDENGSWNTTCTWRRSRWLWGLLRMAGCCQADRPRSPGGGSNQMACASVDLPEPDSPTTPRVGLAAAPGWRPARPRIRLGGTSPDAGQRRGIGHAQILGLQHGAGARRRPHSTTSRRGALASSLRV